MEAMVAAGTTHPGAFGRNLSFGQVEARFAVFAGDDHLGVDQSAADVGSCLPTVRVGDGGTVLEDRR